MSTGLDLLTGPMEDGHPELEMAFAQALVRRASLGEVDEVVRVYRPIKPSVVFGRRDTRRPGFADAVDIVRDAGFRPALRATGGRAVAYTGQAVVIDHVKREDDPAVGQEMRFGQFGARIVETLRALGVDAQLGPVPGEYCPGAHSVNARGQVKLVGTAQRVIRGAWLFSSLVIVNDTDYLRPVLGKVYAALEVPFEESSVGSVSEEAPGLGAMRLERALIEAFAPHASPRPSRSDFATLAWATGLATQHRVDGVTFRL